MEQDEHAPDEWDLPETDGDWFDCTLGETEGTILIDRAEELRIVCRHMVEQARQSIHIFSQNLEADLYDNEPFTDALSTLARRSRYSFVQVLVKDSTPAVKAGHRLIDLYQRLTTHVQIRKLNTQYQEEHASFLIADTTGIIFRRFADRYTAEADYKNPMQARHLLKFFEQAWDISETDPQLRRLHL